MAEDVVVVAEHPKRRRPIAEDDELLTVRDVMEWFQCSRRTVEALVTTGKLRSIKVAGLRRFKRAWVNEYLERRR